MASPLTITRGGVYSGDWTDVSVQTTEPVVLENFLLSGTISGISSVDLTARQGQPTGRDAWDSRRWLLLTEWKRVVVANNTIVNTTGIYLGPTHVPNASVLITKNKHTNPKGNGKNPVGNFVQFAVPWGGKFDGGKNPSPGTIECSWNEIIGIHNQSDAEDIFSLYKAGKVWIHDNLINGQTKPDSMSDSSQNSITVDPETGQYAEPDLCSGNVIERNFVIAAYSIGMFGGYDNLFKENYVVSDGKLADGTPVKYGYSGMFIGRVGSGNRAENNHVGYINGSIHGSQRVDYQEEGGTWTNNTHLPAPITRQTELDHIAMWRKRVSDAGITIGAGGSQMTDAELRDAAVAHLKKTTTGYLKNNGQPKPPPWPDGSTHWEPALDLLAQIGGASPPPDPTYLFQDEFTSYNPGSWQRKWWFNGDTYYHDQTEQIEALRDANVTFSATGALLTAKRENVIDFQGRAKQFTSGMLQTNGIQGVTTTPGPSFTYGKFEARIKAAPGPGMWSCFWLCDAGWPSTCPGEIDIVEITGNNIKVANQNLHAPGTSGATGKAYDTGSDLSAGFHVYGLEWRQNSLAWLFDGAETFRYTGPGIPTSPHYILLNLQVGGSGSWAGTPPLDGSTLPAAMQIDWLRVSA